VGENAEAGGGPGLQHPHGSKSVNRRMGRRVRATGCTGGHRDTGGGHSGATGG